MPVYKRKKAPQNVVEEALNAHSPRIPQQKLTQGARGVPFVAKTMGLCLRADGHGRCRKLLLQSEGYNVSSHNNAFETAYLGIFATPSVPQLYLQS